MGFHVNRLKKLNNNDERVLAFLQNRKSGINSIESFDKIGVHRLSAAVCRLRKHGFDIQRDSVLIENRFGEEVRVARYYLPQ